MIPGSGTCSGLGTRCAALAAACVGYCGGYLLNSLVGVSPRCAPCAGCDGICCCVAGCCFAGVLVGTLPVGAGASPGGLVGTIAISPSCGDVVGDHGIDRGHPGDVVLVRL